MRFARIALLFLAALAGPATAQGPLKAEPAATGRLFAWEITSLTGRLYLCGTVHAGKASFYPLPEAIEKAFAESKVLVVEADITNLEAMERGAATMLLKAPDTLDKHVPAPLYARFRKQLERFAVPEQQVNAFKPFMASTMLAFAEWARLGYMPQYGVDLHFIRKAKESGKRLVELEGAEVQSALIDSFTEKEALAAFEGTVSALESGLAREQVTGMVNAWQAGDPKLLLDVARKYNDSVPGAAGIEEKFIWSRHGPMLDKLEKLLLDSRERHFVAVGALHLAGPKGLVEQLRMRGYIVRQL
jgi:uncharacterized protein